MRLFRLSEIEKLARELKNLRSGINAVLRAEKYRLYIIVEPEYEVDGIDDCLLETELDKEVILNALREQHDTVFGKLRELGVDPDN